MLDLLVKNARCIRSDGIREENIAIENGRIASLLPCDEKPAAESVLDASGYCVLPGNIDAHTHFNEPGYTWREDFSHGSRAAAKGGVTTVVDMPMNNKPPVSTARRFMNKKALVEHESYTAVYSF